ncbi:hypothetical protein QNI19_19550 [Cytophagaceae bacterium DM2B3-1]|uniref:Uncharacterized protein n=1 Tax=Xanthocytophaga flava TaxID=3048013 RepID=A0ABT7CR83_9BACT|nr:hypothetical protein [Xanthocytophaga flavus]MDJ1495144.1 hypothetical protein [Xanthocytophaga flavus]
MKRPISILLLGLLLYNTIGYYLYYEYAQVQARLHLRTVLESKGQGVYSSMENSKDNENWIVFRIPIELYHQIDRDLEPVEGEFRYQDKIYEKALRRIHNDTLYLYCINNQAKEQVQDDLSKHVKTHVVDYTDTHTSKNHKITKLVLQEYLPLGEDPFSLLPVSTMADYSYCPDFSYSSLYPETTSPPPRHS